MNNLIISRFKFKTKIANYFHKSMEQQEVVHPWTSLAKLGFIATSSFSMLLILPVILGSMVETLGYSNQLIGWIATSNALGIALGSLWLPLQKRRPEYLRMLALSLTVILLADTSSAFIAQPVVLMPIRFVAGVFGGITYTIILSVLASLSKPQRGFSLYVLIYCGWSSIGFFSAPYLQQLGGLKLLYGFLVLTTLLSLLFVSVIRQFGSSKHPQTPFQTREVFRQPRIWLSLLSYFAVQAAFGGVWTYLERIGVMQGHSAQLIGQSLSIGELTGIPISLLVYTLSSRFGIKWPIIGGIAAAISSVICVHFAENSALLYFIGVFFLSATWSFLIPLYQMVQAALDTQGKIISFGAFINLSGRSAGPAMVAMLISSFSLASALWFGIFSFLIAFLLIYPSIPNPSKTS